MVLSRVHCHHEAQRRSPAEWALCSLPALVVHKEVTGHFQKQPDGIVQNTNRARGWWWYRESLKSQKGYQRKEVIHDLIKCWIIHHQESLEISSFRQRTEWAQRLVINFWPFLREHQAWSWGGGTLSVDLRVGGLDNPWAVADHSPGEQKKMFSSPFPLHLHPLLTETSASPWWALGLLGVMAGTQMSPRWKLPADSQWKGHRRHPVLISASTLFHI